MPVTIEELREVTDEVVDAFATLLPQLSSSAKPLDAAAINIRRPKTKKKNEPATEQEGVGKA